MPWYLSQNFISVSENCPTNLFPASQPLLVALAASFTSLYLVIAWLPFILVAERKVRGIWRGVAVVVQPPLTEKLIAQSAEIIA
jgi:hypothetical protein